MREEVSLCACDQGTWGGNDETGRCEICEHPNHVGLCEVEL